MATRKKATGGSLGDTLLSRIQAGAQAAKRYVLPPTAVQPPETGGKIVGVSHLRPPRAEREPEREDPIPARRRREVERIARDLERRTAEAEEERERVARQRRRTEAARRTTVLEARVRRLERLLPDRATHLRSRRDSVSRAYATGGSPGVQRAVDRYAMSVTYPEWFPRRYEVSYRPDAAELYVTFQLPESDIVPAATGYIYVDESDAIEPVPRDEGAAERMYRRLVAATGLRTLAELFDLVPPELVEDIVLRGYVRTADPATGRTSPAWLVSVHARRGQFEGLVLDDPRLDPAACLARLGPAPEDPAP